MKIASFDVDAQNGFTANAPQELPVPAGDEIAADLNAMALRADLRLGSKDAHPANAIWVVADPAHMLQPLQLANADLTWVSHCVPGTPGFELLPGLPAPLITTTSCGKASNLTCTPTAPATTTWPSAAPPG